ncbi:type IV pilus assembly protein PilV [Pseudomonas nitritireducens]|uniref:Type IV pilus assembly protein PilV n=1 Tax=Pseudomonas nitroreducens TaxID=46680 RepID=A0A7W7KPJ4_PSENT|nr:type IV pilus modification protein PilV [Pseudomonas nitritireducens]MBB4866605.1 type IV pilus assembly protein PilV [Pseudomonas nitritireducens]
MRNPFRGEAKGMDSRLPARGFSLVELLVSVLILSVGLLGLAGLQSVSVAAGYSSLQRSQASWLASEMTDLLRANPTAARAGAYNLDFAEPGAGCPSSVAGSRAQLDLGQWRKALCTALGDSASGLVQVSRAGELYRVEVGVRWDDSRTQRRLADEVEHWATFTYRTAL